MNESELRVAFEEHKDAAYRFTWRMTNSPAAAEDIYCQRFRCPFVREAPTRERMASHITGNHVPALGVQTSHTETWSSANPWA